MLGVRFPVFQNIFSLDGEDLFPYSEWLKPRQEVNDGLVDRTLKRLFLKVFNGFLFWIFTYNNGDDIRGC